jgi:tellurite resistance protein TerA
VPAQPPGASIRFRWRLGVLVILLAVTGTGVYFLLPSLPSSLTGWFGASLFRPSPVGETSPPENTYPVIDEQTCQLSAEELFSRYHALGENYLKTRKTVTDSNQVRVRLTRNWREADFVCTQGFRDASRREIDRLQGIPIGAHFKEATRLNSCAGELLGKIERELGSETRPALLQRLMRDADRGRNLESDLTNITRDLAFYADKIERLVAEYRSNIEACSF